MDDSLHLQIEATDNMHRWSQLFIPTLREAPADAEVASHKFLVRSGYIRQLGAGIYSYLFLGQRSIMRIIDIVREEMDTHRPGIPAARHPAAGVVGAERALDRGWAKTCFASKTAKAPICAWA